MKRPNCLIAGTTTFLAAMVAAPMVFGQANPSAEADPCRDPDIRTDERPGVGGPPTEISIGLRMVDLTNINDVNQTLTGDFAGILKWTDPRLAHLNGCEIALERIWSPGVRFVNSGRLFPSQPDVANIGPGGAVTYIQRYNTTLASYHKLHDFPFDKQDFHIWLIPLEYGEDEVRLTVNEQFTGRRNLLNISDWTIGEVSATADRLYVEAFGRYHSQYNFSMPAARITTYYILKVFLPICLIVAMSWCVFWMNPADAGAQIGLSATSMLTLIAFIFATTTMLPALGYLTILDKFIGASTILVFLALLQAITTSFLVSRRITAVALRIDRLSRWVFPVVFTVVSLFIVFR